MSLLPTPTATAAPSGPKRSIVPSSPPLPEQAAEPQRRADEDEVVELVEIPFVEQEAVERRELRDEARRRSPGCGCNCCRRSRGRSASPRTACSFTHSGTSCAAWARCSSKATLPLQNSRRLLGADEDAVEELPGEDRAQRQQAERHQHRPRAFVRMIAAGARRRRARRASCALSWPMLCVRDRRGSPWTRVLDMLGRGPARLAEEGQEDQPPANRSWSAAPRARRGRRRSPPCTVPLA